MQETPWPVTQTSEGQIQTEGHSQLSEIPVKGDVKRKKGVTGGAGLGALSKLGKRSRETGMQVFHKPKMKTYQMIISSKVEEEKTSHFVQLDDGTFAEMVEGHEMVAPGRNYFPESRRL